MTIPASAVNTDPNVAGSQSPRAPAELGKADFLNLLIAQLQHQDPLKPLESTEFTAQLAQFTSLEQLTNVNTNLQQLQYSQSTMQDNQAVAFIGKTIDVRGNAVSVAHGAPVGIHFDLGAPAHTVLVNIYDSNGNYVRTIESQLLGAGENMLEWDGRDQTGYSVPDGRYSFEVMAADFDGYPIAAVSYLSAQVTGVSFEDHMTYVLTEDAKYAVADIRRVRQP